MILNIVLVLTGVAAIASVINLVENKKSKTPKVLPMEIRLPGNLPIISLSSGETVFNFLIDSGSNISHICPEYHDMLDAEHFDVHGGDGVKGLGSDNIISKICRTTLKDVLGNEYKIDMVVTEGFKCIADNIEASTGVQIHGLLGTDFLNGYNYAIDFKSLKVYPQK